MSSDRNNEETASEIISKNNENRIKFMAVIRALIANLGIAGVKLVCALISKSSAMLSEAIHSSVDSFNSICLLVGIKRGSRPADNCHPFGYGLEANIWALFASILMLGGTAVAFFSGIDKLVNQHDISELLNNFNLLAITLGVSLCFEGWAVNSATKAVLAEEEIPQKNILVDFLKSITLVRKIKSPTTKFVWFEDVSAFSGVIVAFIAICIAKFVMPLKYAYLPDAIASLIIGCILFCLALYLLKNNATSLTGQSEPQKEEIIKNIASNIHGITKIVDLKTMDMGTSGLIVNMEIEVDSEIQVKEADDITEMLERKIRKHVDNVSHITIEIQAHDDEENWEEKFDKIVKEGIKIEAIDKNEAKMLFNFFSFANTVVKEVMVPRPDVQLIDADDSIDDLIDVIISSGHTRIPVYRDSVDNIIGVVNAKDVLKITKNENKNEVRIDSIIRDILIIPENKFISDLLSEFISTKNQIAAVVDEHGGVAGIVTFEDILEEIVGEIYDEFDKVELPECVQIDEWTLDISSKMDIDDINERYDLDIPSEDFQTIGGYVFGLLGREPEIDDVVEDRNIVYTVLETDGRRISRVQMKKETPFVDSSELEEISETEDVQGE